MLSWRDLVFLDEIELAKLDIALVNLACAEGLPGADKIDVDLCVRTLDQWAKQVLWQTNKQMRRYDKDPTSYYNSRNYFRILMMITVLQRDLGVRYNPAKIAPDAPFDTADSFLHGSSRATVERVRPSPSCMLPSADASAIR